VRSVIQVLTMGWRRDNVSGNPIGGGGVLHIYKGWLRTDLPLLLPLTHSNECEDKFSDRHNL